MQKDIDELKKQMSNKTDCSAFDEEIQRLKDLINQLASSGKEISAPIVQSGPSLSSKELNEFKEALKKVAEHEEKLKGFNADTIMKKLKHLEEELSKKAEKTDIMRLENDKAEKLYVEGEFKAISREMQQFKDWLNRLEDLIKNASKPTN